jgi:hypothetical protein
MKMWFYLLILAMLAFTTGCATGYYEGAPSYETSTNEAPTPGWYRNPETDEEYHRRIWWENYESEREMLPGAFRPFRRFR